MRIHHYCHLFLLSCLTLLLGSVNCRQDQSIGETGCQWNLSKQGFLEELFEAHATPRTPHFDDYTSGSYHVHKARLAHQVRAYDHDKKVLALLIFGPCGPLWCYEIFLFLEEDAHVRLNRVRFPHARITVKATKTLSQGAFLEFINTVESAGYLHQGSRLNEFDYDLLLSHFADGKEALCYSAVPCNEASPAREEIVDYLEDLIRDSTLTYYHDPSARLTNSSLD